MVVARRLYGASEGGGAFVYGGLGGEPYYKYVCYSPLTSWYLLLASCYLLLATCYLLLATCYLPLTIATCYLPASLFAAGHYRHASSSGRVKVPPTQG